MESVYDLTDSLYRQGWEHAESVDDYFYGDFPVLEMKHQVYAMTAMRRYVAKSLSTCESGTQTGEVCPVSWAAQGREERAATRNKVRENGHAPSPRLSHRVFALALGPICIIAAEPHKKCGTTATVR